MDTDAAKRFIRENARPVDLAVYRYFFEGGDRQAVVSERMEKRIRDAGWQNAFPHPLFRDSLFRIQPVQVLRLFCFQSCAAQAKLDQLA